MGNISRSDARHPPPRIRDNEWVVGYLREHGPAKYRFEEENALSYFVRLRTTDEVGERVLWGADLQRAIRDSKSHVKIGQRVAARLVGREPLTPRAPRPGESRVDRPQYKNRWEVETPQFIAERQRTAREILDNSIEARRSGVKNPEMSGLYLILRGAELIAKNRYPDPRDQQEFVARVRALLAVTPEPEVPSVQLRPAIEPDSRVLKSPPWTRE